MQLPEKTGGKSFIRTSILCATPGYVAPEFLSGEVGSKYDVFSFGVVRAGGKLFYLYTRNGGCKQYIPTLRYPSWLHTVSTHYMFQGQSRTEQNHVCNTNGPLCSRLMLNLLTPIQASNQHCKHNPPNSLHFQSEPEWVLPTHPTAPSLEHKGPFVLHT